VHGGLLSRGCLVHDVQRLSCDELKHARDAQRLFDGVQLLCGSYRSPVVMLATQVCLAYKVCVSNGPKLRMRSSSLQRQLLATNLVL
jgi:hypothetical protein